jgi:hypothetical protein
MTGVRELCWYTDWRRGSYRCLTRWDEGKEGLEGGCVYIPPGDDDTRGERSHQDRV